MANTKFMGMDGFLWFIGVVEDRTDPELMGRVRVRALGHHSDSKVDMETKDLPWATVMSSTSNPSMNGLGDSPAFMVEGTWVVGFFQDSEDKQFPIILGTIPGFNLEKPDFTKGFSDPNGKYPRDPVGEPDTNRLSRSTTWAEKHPSLIKRRKMRLTGETAVPIATKPFMENTEDGAILETTKTWEEINPKSNAPTTYPFNHTKESEVGHVFEVDDTPGGERIHQYHNTGTFEEIHPKGEKMVKVVRDNYEVIIGGSNVYIECQAETGGTKPQVNLTVNGDVRHLYKGDYVLEVEGDYTEKIHKNKKTKIKENRYEEILGNYTYNINKQKKGFVGEDFTTVIGGDEIRWNKGKFDNSVTGDWTTIVNEDVKFVAQDTMLHQTQSGIMSLKSGDKLNMKSAATMTIHSENTTDWTSAGLVTETFGASHTNNTTGTFDLNVSTEVDIDSALINLN